MPNTKDLEQAKKNILVYGPTGTGKTQLFATIPGKKLIYMFDHAGLDTLQGQDIDYEYYPPDAPLGVSRTQKGASDPKGPKTKEPLAYANFEDSLEKQIENNFEGYSIVGFDSITSLSTMIMDRILYINGRYGQIPDLSDYNIMGDTILRIYRTVLKCSPTIYLTGHSDLVQDDVSKKVQNQFDVVRNVRRLLPRWFSDVWISLSPEQGKDGKPKFMIQTMPSREWPAAKNSMSLNFLEDTTLDLNRPLEEQGIGSFLRR